MHKSLKPQLAVTLSAAVALTLVIGALSASAAFPGANGKIAFTSERDGNQEIYVMNGDGSGVTRLTSNAVPDYGPAFSADGTRIAFTRGSGPTDAEIYVMNADGSGQTNLTGNAVADYEPSFSPDGSKIAFTSFRDGDEEVYVMNSDGSGQTNLTNNAAFDSTPAFSPDGSKIAFQSNRGGSYAVWAMNANGSAPVNLTGGVFDVQPDFSPDGSKIVFVSARDAGQWEIYVMNANGSGQTRLTNNAFTDGHPVFSPDGTKIAFDRFLSSSQEIWVMNADGTSPVNVSGSSADFLPDWGVDPMAGLVTSVEELALPDGIERSLIAKLQGAQASRDRGDNPAACGQLGAFVNQVEAQSGKKIGAGDAADLIDDVTAIRESMGCDPA